jgi:hypothetical protein
VNEIQRMIIDFEGRHFTHRGDKEAEIAETFDMTPTRYYALLAAAIDEETVLAHSPVLVNRLRRIRDRRVEARALRRAG